MSILSRFRLDDRVAIVTGAGRGIGRGISLALAEAGATVVLAARRENTLEEVAAEIEELGSKAFCVPTDVKDASQLDRLAERTIAELGRVDIVVNNAGGAMPSQALHTSDEAFEEAFHFNVTAALHLSRQVAKQLAAAPEGGSIINISSAMSHLVDSGFVAYATSKAALNHLTRQLAFEWAPKIRANALAVGATMTDALQMVAGDKELLAKMVDMTPMGRLGTTEDIAALALYLASPASSWVTGKVFEIDGGAPASNWPYKMPSGLD